jgi:hypothetical protein
MGIVERVVSRYANSKEDEHRDQSTGKYLHRRWSRLCKLCGHPVGLHSAEKSYGAQPCFHGDLYHIICECPAFTPTQRFMSDEDYARYEKGGLTPDEIKALESKATMSKAEMKALGEKLDAARPRKTAHGLGSLVTNEVLEWVLAKGKRVVFVDARGKLYAAALNPKHAADYLKITSVPRGTTMHTYNKATGQWDSKSVS